MADEKSLKVPSVKTYKQRVKSSVKPVLQGTAVGLGEVVGEVVTGSKFVGSIVGLLAIPTIQDDAVRKSMSALQGKELVKELFM
jgi:hypothetical protein